MAGLLGNPSAPGMFGGLLGNPGQMPQVPFRQNPVVTAIGSSLLAGPGMSGRYDMSSVGPALVAKTAMQGGMQKQKDAAAQKAKVSEAWNAVIRAKSTGQPPPPEAMSVLVESNPAIAGKYFEGMMPAPPKPTSDITNFEYSQENPAFNDWTTNQKKAGATNVTVGGGKYGTIPPGYELVEGPGGTTMQPIRGGPAWQEQQAAETATAGKQATATKYGDVVLTDVRRMKEKIESAPWYAPTTGFAGNILKEVGGTRAADVQALANTIEAGIGFDRLQEMREASKTGGALGAVSERELTLLSAALGSIKQSQSEEQLLENLDRLEVIYTSIMEKAAAYPNAAEYGFSAPSEMPAGGVYEWSPDSGLRPAQ